MKRSLSLTFTAILILCAMIVNGCGGSSDPGQSPVSQITPTEISADDLHAAYNENEIAADKRYKTHVLAVSGIIQTIGKDVFNRPFVILRSKNSPTAVQCFFNGADQTDALAALKSASK